MITRKNISLHKKTIELLERFRIGDESYNSVIWRILNEKKKQDGN